MPPRTIAPRHTRALLAAAALAALFPAASPAGVNKTYTGPNAGFWTTGTWSPIGTPVGGSGATGDSAFITPTVAGAYSVTFNGNYTTAAPLANFTLNALSGNTLTFLQNIAGDNLHVNGNEVIGDTTSATFTQSAANTNAVSTSFIVGNQPAAAGTYNLSAGLLSGSFEFIGLNGPGSFNQSAGSNSLSNTLYLAANPGSTASYALSGGSLTAGSLYLANLGRGTFTQSGASAATFTGDSFIAQIAGGTGAYSLSGSTATAHFNASLYVGGGTAAPAGAGTLNISAGSLSVTNTLKIWNSAGTSAALSGGSLTVGSLDTNGAPGRFTWSGGSLTFTNAVPLVIDSSGPFGTFLPVTGASQSLSAYQLYLGNSGGAAGSVSQTNGTVSLTYSSLAQTGLAIGSAIGGTGAYFLTGGALSAYSEVVAYTSNTSGTFSQSGNSTNSVSDSLIVGNPTSVTAASYSLSAGTLSTHTSVVGRGAGSFSQTGGTHSTAVLQLGYFPDSAGTYSLSAGSLVAASQETLGSDGAATFTQTGGTNATNALYLSYYSDASSSYSLSGTGTLNATVQYLGYTPNSSATFTQSGGSNTASSYISLNPNSLYQLSAGTLATPAITLEPGATFAQSGGTIQSTTTGGYLDNGGTFSYSGGSLSLTLYNEPTGVLDLATNLTAAAGLTNSGNISLPFARTLSVTGQPLYNAGSISLAASTLYTASTTNAGLISGYGAVYASQPISNSGQITLAGGNLTLQSAFGSLYNTGAIDLAAGATLNIVSDTLTNDGALNLHAGTLTGGATSQVVNQSDGVLTGPGTVTVPTLYNFGTLVVPDGTTRTPGFANQGVIQLAGPAANLITSSPLSNFGTIQGYGKISATLSNSGTIEATGNATLVLANLTANTSVGTLAASAGNKLLVSNLATNAGTISLTGGTFDASSTALTNAPTGTLAGNGTFRISAGLTNNGNVLLSAGPSYFYGPLTANPASKIILSGNATATFYNNVNLLAGSELRVSTGSAAVFFAPLTGSGQITGAGSKFFEAGASAPASLATGGDTTVDSPASLTTTYLNESSLTAYGPVILLPDSPASTLATLELTTSGSLDLSNDTLNLTGTSVPALRSYLASGQLFSSLSDSTHSLGYLPGLLVKLTLKGDANLDGTLNADDYALLDAGFATAGSTWWRGDFNYDGVVTPADYLILDSTYLSTHAPSPDFLAQRSAQFGPAYVSALLANVPEPFSLSSILYPLFSLLLTRRRRRR